MDPPGDWGTWLAWGPTAASGLVAVAVVYLARNHDRWREARAVVLQVRVLSLIYASTANSDSTRAKAGMQILENLGTLDLVPSLSLRGWALRRALKRFRAQLYSSAEAFPDKVELDVAGLMLAFKWPLPYDPDQGTSLDRSFKKLRRRSED